HEEWTLAYCQSELYVDYLIREYGPEVIGKLLEVFREGVTSAEAVERVCGIEVTAFEESYRAYITEVAGPFRDQAPGERLLTLAELEAAVKKDPDAAGLKAQLA